MKNEVTAEINREHKDRLFKFIFGKDTEESKQWRLQLYNALNGTNITDPDELEINTIENIIYITMHNDISFIVDVEMNLYEEQSSWNPNMPLRGFFYFASLYQIHLNKNKVSILRHQKIMIPRPRFFVFYHGKATEPDTWKLKLSDSFLGEPRDQGEFEWTATVINLRPDKEFPLNKKCTPLYHYVRFVSMVTANVNAGMDRKTAVERAVDEAIKEKLLGNFFRINKAEVIGMFMTEFDEELAIRNWRQDGRAEKAIEDAVMLINDYHEKPEVAAQKMNAPLDKVLEAIKPL